MNYSEIFKTANLIKLHLEHETTKVIAVMRYNVLINSNKSKEELFDLDLGLAVIGWLNRYLLQIDLLREKIDNQMHILPNDKNVSYLSGQMFAIKEYICTIIDKLNINIQEYNGVLYHIEDQQKIVALFIVLANVTQLYPYQGSLSKTDYININPTNYNLNDVIIKKYNTLQKVIQGGKKHE